MELGIWELSRIDESTATRPAAHGAIAIRARVAGVPAKHSRRSGALPGGVEIEQREVSRWIRRVDEVAEDRTMRRCRGQR